MPPRRLSITRPDATTYRSWGFVIVLGLVLAVLALLDRGSLGETSVADGSTGCQLEVAADELNVRSGASADAALVETLTRGDRVDATPVVVDGYRELENDRWAADRFLAPLPGTNCG